MDTVMDDSSFNDLDDDLDDVLGDDLGDDLEGETRALLVLLTSSFYGYFSLIGSSFTYFLY